MLIGCARLWAATATSGTQGACVVSADQASRLGGSWEWHLRRIYVEFSFVMKAHRRRGFNLIVELWPDDGVCQRRQAPSPVRAAQHAARAAPRRKGKKKQQKQHQTRQQQCTDTPGREQTAGSAVPREAASLGSHIPKRRSRPQREQQAVQWRHNGKAIECISVTKLDFSTLKLPFLTQKCTSRA